MSDGSFRHGVASGDPLPEGVTIWARVAAPDRRATELSWVVARDPELEQVAARGTAIAHRDRDWTVAVDVDGLAPSTTYYYAFSTTTARSAIGRTRTAPAPGCERLRIAVVSCAKYTAGYFNAYARVAERDDLDLVLHLGDYIYVAGNDDPKAPAAAIGRAVEPGHEAWTLTDYRCRYAQQRSDPDLQRLHLRHPMIATIDDNDIANDAWRDGAGGHDPSKHGQWQQRKRDALQAWQEWIPARLPRSGQESRIFRSFALGALADLFVLDERTYRDQQRRGAAMAAPDRTMLGGEQYAWLTSGLEQSRATWRIVANPVMFGRVFTELEADEVGQPLSEVGVLSKADSGPDPDQWDGYPAERDRLLRHVRDRAVANVVVVSGDVHTSWAVELVRDDDPPATPPIAVEFVTPSVTSENLDDLLHVPARTRSRAIEQRILADNRHIRWVELDGHGYLLLEITAERIQASWHFVRTHLQPDDRAFTAATWQVNSGEPRLSSVAR